MSRLIKARQEKITQIYLNVNQETKDMDSDFILRLLKMTLEQIELLQVREGALRRLHHIQYHKELKADSDKIVRQIVGTK